MITHDEMVLAKVNLQSVLDNEEIVFSKRAELEVAIQALDTLLNAGECFKPKKSTKYGEHECEALTGCPECVNEGYDQRADEDTAILLKRMMGIEGVIFNILNSPNFDVMLGHNEKLMKDISNRIALAITAHLTKGGKDEEIKVQER